MDGNEPVLSDEPHVTDLARRYHLLDRAAYQDSTPDLTIAARARLLGRFEDQGYERVGRGAARVVFRLPPDAHPFARPHVLKVARYGETPVSDGRLQNRTEYRIWRAVEEERLLPVREAHADYFWTLVPRAVPVRSHPSLTGTEIRNGVRELERELPTPLRNADITPENVGIYRGRFRLLDYGYFG